MESKEREYVIDDVDSDVFQVFVSHVYEEESQITTNNIFMVLQVCDSINLRRVIFLRSNFSDVTCLI